MASQPAIVQRINRLLHRHGQRMRAVRRVFAAPVEYYDIWQVRVPVHTVAPTWPIARYRPDELTMLEGALVAGDNIWGHGIALSPEDELYAELEAYSGTVPE